MWLLLSYVVRYHHNIHLIKIVYVFLPLVYIKESGFYYIIRRKCIRNVTLNVHFYLLSFPFVFVRFVMF